ncbi:hypothetical protein VTK73DRAFT_5234 [Phialemonium thermophilum]|uniref:Uncharacterized protein n=1 Tax=Phialemonium thermophilum TaxID=223376 RepID=A0ABR3V2N7_9PEZI
MQSGAGRESSDQRPLLLFLCHPLTGHLTPTLRVAAALHARGWPVSFLGPTAHRDRILASGAAFFPLLASADIDDLAYYAASTREYRSLSWSERALVDVERQWYAPIPDQWSSLRAALSRLHRDDPARDVIVVCEAIFHGILPLFFGADLAQSPSGPDEAAVPSPLAVPRILGTLCLSVTVPLIRSADLPPFGFALPYDASPEGRARNAACWAAWAAHTTRLQGLLDEALRKAGATKPFDGVVLSGENYLAHARILQLGVPGFFYPRTDWPDKLQIVGLSPPPPTTSASLPSWAPSKPIRATSSSRRCGVSPAAPTSS